MRMVYNAIRLAEASAKLDNILEQTCKCSNNACIVVAFRIGSILTKVNDDQLPEEVLYMHHHAHDSLY